MLMKCAGSGWSAELLVSDEISPDGLVHCQIKMIGDSQDEVLRGTQYLFQIFTGGRDSAIRAYPEASSDRDATTKKMYHKGYARFSVLTTPDKQTDLTNNTGQISFAALGQTVTSPESLPSRDPNLSTDGIHG